MALGAIVASAVAAAMALAVGTAVKASDVKKLKSGEKRLRKVKKIAVREARKVAKGRGERRVRVARKKKRRAKAVRRKKRKAIAKKPRKPTKPTAKKKAHTVRVVIRKKKKTPPKPTPKKKKRRKTARLTPKKAAEQLYSYVQRMIAAGDAHLLGTKGKPNAEVKRLQRDMRRIKADGQYATKTRRRGKELLGRPFPIRRKVDIKKRKPPEPSKPDDVEVTNGRTSEQAANDLYSYVASVPHDAKRGAALGYRDNPNDMILDAQLDMGMTGDDADGIYGPDTRALGRELTGKIYPIR